MTAQQIINLALSNTHTKSTQVSASNLLLFFNIIRHELGNAIIKDVNENYFFQIWTIDAADNTHAERENGEYLYPVASSTQAGMQKLLRLAIKGLSTDVYYTPCHEADLRSTERDWLWHIKNQPKADPIYFIGDNSFFIAPEFKTADLPTVPLGNKQIKAYGIAKFVDLDASDQETSILIPSDFHPLIAKGMEQYILKSRSKKTEAQNAKIEYENDKLSMIDALTNRDDSPMIASLPNDDRLGFGE